MSHGHRLAALVSLAIGRQAQFPVEQHQTYLDLLGDISDEKLIEACRELAKRPRADREPAMPSVGTIRETIGKIADRKRDDAETRKLLRVANRPDDEPLYDCGAGCRDTGWIEHNCPGAPRATCGRLRCYPHTYVTPCSCDARRVKVA